MKKVRALNVMNNDPLSLTITNACSFVSGLARKRFGSSGRIRRMASFPVAALLAVCLLALPATGYAQKTWIVTSLTDNVYYNPDCTSGKGNDCTLRTAIDMAFADTNDTIEFAPGLMGTIVLNSSYGTLNVQKSMSILGPGANLLAVSGMGRVTVFAVESGVTAQISGLTIANGNAGGVGNPRWGQPSYFGAGGGIYVYAGATVTVNNCALTGNIAAGTDSPDFGGGAIYNGGTLTMNSSTLSRNSATGAGGAILNYLGSMTIINSTFYGNSAGVGGALYDTYGGTQSVIVLNCTITGNTTNGDGGGILEAAAGNRLFLANSLVAGNQAAGPDADCGGNCQAQVAALVGGNPQLGPLAWNGGTTQTMMPLPGSPAIGFSDGTETCSWGITSDQRGFFRASCGAPEAVDAGAVQTHYLTVTNTADSGTGSLREALNSANSGKYGVPGSAPIYSYKPGADIQIATGGTIILNSPLPEITGIVNIVGPGANQLTIIGNGSDCGLSVGPHDLLAVSGINITGVGGASSDPNSTNGGGICTQGALTVSASSIAGNGGTGIYTEQGGRTALYASTISSNGAIYGTNGGGIRNLGTMAVVNSTVTGNSVYPYGGGGGGIDNEGVMLVSGSTISGNFATTNGGGISNAGEALTIVNSIVAGNSTGGTPNSGDCYECGSQSTYNLIGGNPQLSPLQPNGEGAVLWTMIPLPGSPAISLMGDGNTIIMDPSLTTDERGFPRSLGTIMDYGAVQTDYTSVQFVQQPTNSRLGQTILPAPTVEVMETNNSTGQQDAVNGIPVTLSFSGGPGEIAGALTDTTANGVATFSGLAVNTAGSNDSFTVSSPVLKSAQVESSTFSVGLTPVNMSVSCWNPSFAYGGYYQCQINLSSNEGSPVGSITYAFDSGAPVSVPVVKGFGQFVIDSPVVGSHQVVVTYPQQSGYGAATQTETFTVIPAPVNVALTPSTYYASVGTAVTFQAAVTSWSAGTPDATGTVSFLNGSTLLATVPVNSSGQASYTTNSLPAGTLTITADYSNGANYANGSATATITLTP